MRVRSSNLSTTRKLTSPSSDRPRDLRRAATGCRPICTTRLRVVLVLLVALFSSSSIFAEEAQNEETAALLLRTTVTVRILPPRGVPAQAEHAQAEQAQTEQVAPVPRVAGSDAGAAEPAQAQTVELAAPAQPAVRGVSVGSGVSLGEGRILTFSRIPAEATAASIEQQEFRVTLPDGEQAIALPRVADHYSGLLLLEIEQKKLPALAVAEELPKIGGAVLTAAAAGIEQPLVSLGVLSGVERTIPGANLPPMIQCDISTTDASSGAALLDGQQRLIGILAATDSASQQFGWSFAVPYPHIRRVLEAYEANRLIVLVRQRPIVGLKLGPGPREGTVVVERVAAGGPAEQAGIRQGEIVFEADGRKIRSAYQAVAIILKRLPGDQMNFLVGSESQKRTAVVTLQGSTSENAPAPQNDEGQYQVGPQVNVRVVGPNKIEVRNRQRVAELSVTENNLGVTQNTAPASPMDELELLQKQLRSYQDLITVMQQERLTRQAKEKAQEAALESLRQEIRELQKDLPGK